MESKVITVTIASAVQPEGPIQGFRFFWAFYVNGFRHERHCQPCFKGKLDAQMYTGNVQCGQTYRLSRMDRYPNVNICGVGAGPKDSRRGKNLHLPIRYEPGETVRTETYNGYVIRAENAVRMEIPPLPEGWQGRSFQTTSCKNFQFGVAYFGSA